MGTNILLLLVIALFILAAILEHGVPFIQRLAHQRRQQSDRMTDQHGEWYEGQVTMVSATSDEDNNSHQT